MRAAMPECVHRRAELDGNMGSTIRSLLTPHENVAGAAAPVTWRVWPLVDHANWSWLVLAAIVGLALVVRSLGGGWLLAILAIAGLVIAGWQFFLPTAYVAGPLGIRRTILGRSRLTAWTSIKAYQLRPTGVVLYQRPDPVSLDHFRALFIPYPPNEDDLVGSIREYLSSAVELPLARRSGS